MADGPTPHHLSGLRGNYEEFIAKRRESRATERILTDIDHGTYALHWHATPPGLTGTRGYAGGVANSNCRNVCVIDALLQVCLRAQPALNGGSSLALICQVVRDIRKRCNIAEGEPIFAADAWPCLAAIIWPAGGPRPHLCEIGLVGATMDGKFHGHHMAPHASYGPWDGRLLYIATGEGHTEPVKWTIDGTPAIPPMRAIKQGKSEGPLEAQFSSQIASHTCFLLSHGFDIVQSFPRGIEAVLLMSKIQELCGHSNFGRPKGELHH